MQSNLDYCEKEYLISTQLLACNLLLWFCNPELVFLGIVSYKVSKKNPYFSGLTSWS